MKYGDCKILKTQTCYEQIYTIRRISKYQIKRHEMQQSISYQYLEHKRGT